MSIQSIIHQSFLELLNSINKSYTSLIRRFMLLERFGVGKQHDRDKARMLMSLDRIIQREDTYFTDKRKEISEKIRVLINSIKDIYE